MAMKPLGGNAVTRRGAAAALLVLGSLLAFGAEAGLGESVESVQRDHVALHGTTLAVTPMLAYDLHEITTADGTRVRQYVSRAGAVFAVAWSGRSLPDLKVVLGEYYGQYVAAAAAPHGFNHHVLAVATPELVLNVTRLPRGFVGGAHLPALVPEGVTVRELR